MALSKKQKSYLLVAVLAGGTIIGEGIGLYKLNESVDSLQKTNTQLELKVNNLNKSIEEKNNVIKEKDNTIKEKNDTINNVTKERDNNQKSIEKLQKENKELNQKLEAKKKEEASAMVASAEHPTQSVSRGIAKRGTPVTITLTFYGDGADENGGYAGLNAYSQKLSAGMVASNVYPRGTKFVTPDGQVFTVNDKGGPNFNSFDRLDVFVPRKSGESDDAYKKRIYQLGRKTVTLYKL